MPVTTPLIWRDQYALNPVTAGIQQDPVITALANGNMIAVFEDRAPGGERNLTGVLLDPLGNVISTHNLLAGFATGREDEQPSISATGNGGFVLAFEYGAGDDDDIRFARFDAAVNRVATGTVVNDNGSDTTYLNPQIIWRPGGTSVVIYEKRLGELEQIAYRIMANDGTRGPEVILRTDTGTTAGNPTDPAAALLADGRVVVVFEEDDSGDEGVAYRIIAPNGDLSAPTNVATFGRAFDPDVAATANGGFVVVWDQSDDNIYARRYDADGAALGPVFLAGNNAGNKNEAQVVGLDDGGFFVAWDNDSTSGMEGRRFDADGVPVGGLLQIGGPSPATPDMTLTADGRIMVVWDGDEIDAVILDPRDGTITVDGGTPTTASPEGSRLIGSGADDLFYGQSGRDTLEGRGGADDLLGGIGNDRLIGGKGADTLKAGKGRDELAGGSGRDRLAGQKGDDDLTGGAKADTFVFAKGGDRDRISDFRKGNDRLELNDNLWSGNSNAQDVVDDFASKSGGNITLNFGGGDRLVLEDFTNLGKLDTYIDIV